MRSCRLARIQNWPQRAHDAKYSVRALAKACGVSVRTLERFFLPAFSEPPRGWLKRLRMRRAVELLRDGSNVSETAFCLGHEDPSHFSREFKKGYGYAPHHHTPPPPQVVKRPKMSHSAMKLSRLAMKS
jgi:transcriptional regulator GlxA family with amidase domain